MLITIIVVIATIFADIINAILPNWDIAGVYYDEVTFMFQQMKFYNGYIPINASLIALFWIISFESLILTYRFTGGIISLIRGGGSTHI